MVIAHRYVTTADIEPHLVYTVPQAFAARIGLIKSGNVEWRWRTCIFVGFIAAEGSGESSQLLVSLVNKLIAIPWEREEEVISTLVGYLCTYMLWLIANCTSTCSKASTKVTLRVTWEKLTAALVMLFRGEEKCCLFLGKELSTIQQYWK